MAPTISTTGETYPASPQTTAQYRRQLRLVVTSSFLGSTMEYYDFLLYATMSGLVFGQVFFSGLDPVTGTIASFGTLAIGYFARPIGGIVFGHFGDRIGRKRMLYLSLFLMAGSSVLIGVLPTSQQIGGGAAVLLVLLRLVQGFALGGEWGGSVLLTGEHAKTGRNFWTSFTSAGGPAGSLLATGTIAIVSSTMSPEAFIGGGWRIPFLASILLLAIGLFVRYRVQESPIFVAEVAAADGKRRFPVGVVLTKHWRGVLTGIGFTLSHFVVTTIVNAFIIAYAIQLGFERQGIITAVAIAGAVSLVAFLGWGAVSDKLGRRVTLVFGALSTIVFAFALFSATASGSIVWVGIAIICGNVFCIGLVSATATSAVPELFPTEVRYSGASLTFQVSGALGGLAPLIFTSILASGGGNTLPISLIIAGLAVIAVIAALVARETKQTALGRRADEPVLETASKVS